MNFRVVGTMIVVSVMTSLMFGAVPALLAGVRDPAKELVGQGRTVTASRRTRRLQGRC